MAGSLGRSSGHRNHFTNPSKRISSSETSYSKITLTPQLPLPSLPLSNKATLAYTVPPIYADDV